MKKYKVIGFLKILCHPGDLEAQDKIAKEYGFPVEGWDGDWDDGEGDEQWA